MNGKVLDGALDKKPRSYLFRIIVFEWHCNYFSINIYTPEQWLLYRLSVFDV